MQGAGFGEVARVAQGLAAESGRLKKRSAIVEALLRVVGPDAESSAARLRDAGLFCLYLAGQAFAEADPRKLNVGGALLTRVLKQVSGCTDAALTAAYRRHGDLGAAAFEVWPEDREEGIGERGEKLALTEVAEAFGVMASARTTAVRSAAVEGLLLRADALEAMYLLKLMLGDMRIGVKQSLVEEAIAAASGTELAAVRHAVMLEADLARAVERAFAGTLADARMRLFHPLGFMLASPVETPEEAVARFGGGAESDGGPKYRDPSPSAQDDGGSGMGIQAFLEDKYDGMRAQVHCGDPEQPGRVVVYSRNREEITESFPEIVEAFAGVREPLILDGELVGWDFAAPGL
jgi:DNA ligase-1